MPTSDEFTERTARVIAARAGYRCAFPECGAPTSGPQVAPSGALNVGVAGHITAASPGGPRFNPSLTSAQRRSASNGLWLCQTHGKLVDNDESAFDVATLQRLKATSEANALAQVGRAVRDSVGQTGPLSPQEAELLIESAIPGELFLIGPEQTGPWVAAGGRDFLDPDDPRQAALYVDALEHLIRRALVRHEAGILYTLTSSGFDVARRLKAFISGDAGSAH